MSGPIVRRYGFPNFEKIFGERNLEHGADAPEERKPEERKPSEADQGTGLPPDLARPTEEGAPGSEMSPPTEFGNAVG